MNRAKWESAIRRSAKGDNKLFNTIVVDLYRDNFKDALTKFIKDENDVEEVYTISITKFWERFVLLQEDLPTSNIEGYLYKMAYNAYVYILKRRNKKKVIAFSPIDESNIADIVSKIQYPQNLPQEDLDTLSKSEILERSISRLATGCQRIIKMNVMSGSKLIDIQDDIDYNGSYNGLVKMKQRCIKRLARIFFKELQTSGVPVENYAQNGI